MTRRLTIVVNMHHYDEMALGPAAHQARFPALWQQIAEHYQSYPICQASVSLLPIQQVYSNRDCYYGVQIVPSGQRLCVHWIGAMPIGYFAAFVSSISIPKPGLSFGHKYPLCNSGIPGKTSLSGSPKKIIS